MDYLGSGLHFDVVADGDLAIKHPSPAWRIAGRCIAHRPGMILKPGRLARAVRFAEQSRDEMMSAIARTPLPEQLTAHARVYEDVILQNRVTPLGEAIRSGSDPFRVVDGYIDSVIAGWSHGLADASFRMLSNHGIDDEGRVVIVSIGDLTFDRRIVAHGVARSIWENVREVRTLPAGVLRYYMDQMAERITPGRLDAEWPLNVRRCRTSRPRPREEDRPLRRQNRTTSSERVPSIR